MKKFLVMLAFMVIAIGIGIQPSYAGEIDLLVQKLVDKGILTTGEAQQILTETKEEMKKQLAEGKADTAPQWVQNIKQKGDFRLRYQVDRAKGAADDRTRARIRLRYGAEAKANDQMKVGLGLATGTTSDPRSTNVTIGGDANNPGSFKSVILDYAYAQYTPTTWATLTGGKFKNPIWQPNDLLWDTDLNPEGATVQLNKKLNDKFSLFMNTMIFGLGESASDKSDPTMYAFQPGANWAINDQFGLKGTLAYYLSNSIKNKAKFSNQSSNTLVGTDYKYSYNAVNPSLELSIKEPFKILPYVALFADAVYNPNPETKKTGFDFGLKFGDEKVSDLKQWQARVLYAKLEKDAWLDIFPDSDRYSGKTNMDSYEAVFEYGLGKNSTLALDYYYGRQLTKTGTSYLPAHVLQIDWNLKF